MSNSKNAVKSAKLGMNYQTARCALERDLIFKFAIDAGHKCFRCSEPLARENFSIDHKENWSEAADPKAAFFDLGNIAFSHQHCNARYTSRLKYLTPEEQYAAQLMQSRVRRKIIYTPEARRARYQRTGS